jgi:D-alanine--poly(phosphoribitol) ligase subunit 1
VRNSVLEYLEETVRQCGDKPAIVDGSRQLTFRQLRQLGRQLARKLLREHDSFREPIAVLLPKSADSIIAFVGILYSGNFYVPLDEKLPKQRMAKILANLQPTAIITVPEYTGLLASLGVDASKLVLIKTVWEEPAVEEERRLNDILEQVADVDPVYVIYTSGSTGTPKGVVVAQRGVVDYIDWAIQCFAIDEKTVIGSQSPFFFDNSTLDIYLCLGAGATLVIIPKTLFSFPAKLMAYVKDMGINFIFWVPSVLINVANAQILDEIVPPALTKILFAGEVMPNKQLNYWRKKMPKALFANLYGPTEITVDCTYYILDREFADHEPLPIGIPCRNTDILVLNAANRQAVLLEMGELCVRGSSLALGYWDDPVKTAAVFVQNPLHAHYPDMIYRTGDLVYRNERREIIFVGRKDSQIKHMGYRIELGEIETAIAGLAVIESACVTYNKKKEEIVLLYKAFQPTEFADIRKALLPLLPKYMMPTMAYQLDEMLLNANGKIDRVALVNRYGQQEEVKG